VKTAYPDLEYFRRAAFLKSVEQLKDLPADEGAEVAFIGRSNVGKSSVLNALCDHQGLARTSRTPGRTQHFVVFDLGGPRRLIDLPGFGYAVVNKSMRAHWDEMIPRYLEERASLAGLVLIADARHPLKSEELALIEWTASACVPQTLLLNKADKLGLTETGLMRAQLITLIYIQYMILEQAVAQMVAPKGGLVLFLMEEVGLVVLKVGVGI
jgi:GTP-binding protein